MKHFHDDDSLQDALKKTGDSVQLPETVRIRSKAKLFQMMRQAQSTASEARKPAKRLFMSLSRTFAIVVLVFFLGFGSMIGAAQADESKPGDPLFGLDKLIERMQLFLTMNPESKLKLQIEIAAERLQELADLTMAFDESDEQNTSNDDTATSTDDGTDNDDTSTSTDDTATSTDDGTDNNDTSTSTDDGTDNDDTSTSTDDTSTSTDDGTDNDDTSTSTDDMDDSDESSEHQDILDALDEIREVLAKVEADIERLKNLLGGDRDFIRYRMPSFFSQLSALYEREDFLIKKLKLRNSIRINNRIQVSQLHKVTICHKPESVAQTLEVALSAWPAHKAHGDVLGGCIIETATDNDDTSTSTDDGTDNDDTSTSTDDGTDNDDTSTSTDDTSTSTDDGTDNDGTSTSTDDGTDNDDTSTTTDDMDDSDESASLSEVEVHITGGIALVSVELNDRKRTFRVRSDNRDAIIQAIADQLGVTTAAVEQVIKIESEHDDDDEDERGKSWGNRFNDFANKINIFKSDTVKVEGIVESVSSGSIVVDGQSFTVSSKTDVDVKGSKNDSLNQELVGRWAKVKGATQQNGSIVATDIDIK